MMKMILQLKNLAVTLLLVVLGGMEMVNAAGNYRTLVVSKIDGTELRFTLTTNLQLSFSDECLQVRDEAVSIDVSRSMLDSFSFSEDEAGIERVESGGEGLSSMATANGVRFCNLPGDVMAKLYTIDGKLIKTFMVSDGMMVPYSDFAPGLNVVEIEGVAFKILVR